MVEDYAIRCTTCGNSQSVDMEDYKKYLNTGWPQCCGYTMLLEKV